MKIYIPTSKKQGVLKTSPSVNKEELLHFYDWVDDLVIEEKEYKDYLLEQLPKEFHSCFKSHAYKEGHAFGQDEVDGILADLVSDFLPAINQFRDNLLKNVKT